MVHEKGFKGDRDRAALIVSYNRMTKVFRTPRGKRLTVEQIARMTNSQLYQASKDLYNTAPIRKARKIAVIAGLESRGESALERVWHQIKVMAFGLTIKPLPKKRKINA